MPQKQKKVIAFFNMKGGVGKTTLAVNIAYALAYFNNKKVLLIDVDPQFNATSYLMEKDHYIEYLQRGYTVLDIFKPRSGSAVNIVSGNTTQTPVAPATLANTVVNIYRKGVAKLDLIPSTLELVQIEYAERGTEFALKTFIDDMAREAYDVIIIDCPPTLTIYTTSAYLASDAIVIPVKPDELSSLGLPLLDWGFEKYRAKFGSRPSNMGIIFNMVDKRGKPPLADQKMSNIIASGRKTFKNYLKVSTNIGKAVGVYKPIFLFAKTKNTEHAKAIQRISDEFIINMESL